MHLLSLPSATVLGLVASTHLVVGAALQRRTDTDNQVNYYSDVSCQNYLGTWEGPTSRGGPATRILAQTYSTTTNGQPLWLGSVYPMYNDGNFDSLAVNNTNNARCPPTVLQSSNQVSPQNKEGYACYVINTEVSSVTLYLSDQCSSNTPA
jgi:hypothetical protein